MKYKPEHDHPQLASGGDVVFYPGADGFAQFIDAVLHCAMKSILNLNKYFIFTWKN
jgi:hypothetical protein